MRQRWSKSARGNRSDGMEDLPDAWTDSRGRGEKERTPKKAKKAKNKSEIVGLKYNKRDGPNQQEETGMIEWKTYQMPEEMAEEGDTK